MKEIKFQKEIKKIQTFLNLNDWDFMYRFQNNPGFLGEVTNLDYTRFTASFTFDTILLEKPDKEIRMVIMHECSHIFTIANLRQFSEDDYLKNSLGFNTHASYINLMNILNEQMTVRLERLLTKSYVKSISNHIKTSSNRKETHEPTKNKGSSKAGKLS